MGDRAAGNERRDAPGAPLSRHSAAVHDFTADPHTAIVGESRGEIRNLVDGRARPAQRALLSVARGDPARTLAEVRSLEMPAHHDVRRTDVNERRLGAVLALAHERDVSDFASLLLLEQFGPRTLQSLALIAEVVHGAPTRFADPARFSFAHGGKDGHPFPVPLQVYDESLGFLRRALDAAKLGQNEKLQGFARLDAFTRLVEDRLSPQADVHAAIAHERALSPSLGGRTVFDDKKLRRQAPAPRAAQLELFPPHE